MGSDSENKSILTSHRFHFKVGLIALAFAIIAVSAGLFRPSSPAQSETITKEEWNYNVLLECIVPTNPRNSQSDWNTKPILFPTFPTSLKESTHRAIINAMMGNQHSGKSYYSMTDSGSLHRCFGTTETVSCSNIHPIIGVAHLNDPNTNQDSFYGDYAMAIRNPMTAVPAFLNEKQINYHGLTGKMSDSLWHEVRDVDFDNLINEWVSVVTAWKDSSYEIGMYLVYEDLYDIIEGPKALKRLRSMIERAGFTSVVDEAYIDCIWSNAVRLDEQQLNHAMHYEYSGDIPGYTQDQKQRFLNALSELSDMYEADVELVSILQRYSTDINHHMRIIT